MCCSRYTPHHIIPHHTTPHHTTLPSACPSAYYPSSVVCITFSSRHLNPYHDHPTLSTSPLNTPTQNILSIHHRNTPSHPPSQSTLSTHPHTPSFTYPSGVSLRDIERHLDKRTLKVTRRPGNAKAWRSEKADSILGNTSAGTDDSISYCIVDVNNTDTVFF